MKDPKVTMSKFLSLVLRHQPQTIGVTLDRHGWIDIDTLIAAASAHGRKLTHELLLELVETSDKQRFAVSDDGLRVRANQGHSIHGIDLELTPQVPPETLFHGTIAAVLPAIRREGLLKQARHHVHLSASIETAERVGARRGKPVILIVAARAMHEAGIEFYRSANGVWLVDAVPPEYLRENSK
ncbi:MAG: RNA 2'-phosphotransferase [Pirellulaceae bacterium]